MTKRLNRFWAAATLSLACSACDGSRTTTRTAPPYEIVGSRAGVRYVVMYVVIDERTLSSDEAIWRVADDIKVRAGKRPLQISFWTNRDDAPTSIPMSRQSGDAERAVINIDESYGTRLLYRNKGRAQ